MTEEKAKEILDFLAKKAGYGVVSIKRKYSRDKSIQFRDKSIQFVIVCKCELKLDLDNTLYDIDCRLYAANHSCPNFSTIFIKSMSYVNALKTILKLSKARKDIFCRNSLILPACTSLEEILIEMDLEETLASKI